MRHLTVTQLYLCQRCPRLFAYSKVGKNTAWKVGLDGIGSLSERRFHDITKVFHTDASGHGNLARYLALIGALSSPCQAIQENVLELLRVHYFVPFLKEHSRDLTDLQVMAIAQGLDRWGRYLGEFLTSCIMTCDSPEGMVQSVFHKAECLITAVHQFPDAMRLYVRGKPDALLFDPLHKDYVVLEFKGHRATDITVDLAQTVLYAWLVSSGTRISPMAEVLYLEGEPPLTKYSSEEVQAAMIKLPSLFLIVRKVVERDVPLPRASDPHLCNVCRFSRTCDKDWGNVW